MILAAVCSCQYQYIIIIDIFFLIGQFQKLLIYLIQFFLIQVNSQQRQAILQCRTSATGSTAQKLMLNMLSTAVMIRLGRVEGNRMVNMQLTNDKLVGRGTRMVAEASGLSEAQARALLLQYGSVKKALEHAPKPE